MKENPKNNEFINWYKNNLKEFERIAHSVSSLITNLLQSKKIDYHTVTYRVKNSESLMTKVITKGYKNPKKDVQDFVGIRIITFFKSDVEKVSKLIEENFTIDEDNSADKSIELGDDRVGYRSVHYIAKINKQRKELIEYSTLIDYCFEIQIRTILEHAWAEITHDRAYKPDKVLPKEKDINRRFALAAASLELIDLEFDRVNSELKNYSNQIKSEINNKNMKQDINSTSLQLYFEDKFSDAIDKKDITLLENSGTTFIKELEKFDIFTLEELDSLITSSKNILSKVINISNSPEDIIRLLLLTKDPDKYFSKRPYNQALRLARKNTNFLSQYNNNIDEIIKDKILSVTRKK